MPRAPCQCKNNFLTFIAFDLVLKTGYTYKVNEAIEGVEKIRFDFNKNEKIKGDFVSM